MSARARAAMPPPQEPARVPRYDAVVVGAGPYGLSTAAHLAGRGLTVAVFGKTLELWRDHMPKGMMLRSHWWATNLSDPRGAYGFARFLAECSRAECFPVPLDLFVNYGLWFKERAVPYVDETYVCSIERQNGHFLVQLADGRSVASRAVVMAIGVSLYANRPASYGHLPAGLVSHSCDHSDPSRFKGQQVLVLGGGASGTDFAALLHEAGATVHMITRRPIVWFGKDRTNERTLVERIKAPNNGMAPGWANWTLEHMPFLFHRFPQDLKDRYNSNYVSGATDWLRASIIGKAALHERQEVERTEVVDDKVVATISDGTKVTADHLILATGYKVDVNKLTMIHPMLRAEIKADRSIPVLDQRFESSVPGFYFVGLTSVRAFGPLYRFVVGCKATAERVAASIARARSVD